MTVERLRWKRQLPSGCGGVGHPSHRMKVAPAAGVAESVTGSPGTHCVITLLGQANPHMSGLGEPVPVTVTEPCPAPFL